MGRRFDSGGGLHTKPAGQAGYVYGLLYARRAGNCRLPEICQTDLYAAEALAAKMNSSWWVLNPSPMRALVPVTV